jgi:hypothetical protein
MVGQRRAGLVATLHRDCCDCPVPFLLSSRLSELNMFRAEALEANETRGSLSVTDPAKVPGTPLNGQ